MKSENGTKPNTRSKPRKPRTILDGTATFGERTMARKLGVSYMTVFRARQAKQIPFYRIGNRVVYDDSCLAAFLARSRVA